jgi:hypothetical protein
MIGCKVVLKYAVNGTWRNPVVRLERHEEVCSYSCVRAHDQGLAGRFSTWPMIDWANILFYRESLIGELG